MSKRFTETDKWRSPSFRKLPPEDKLIYFFIYENCDNAGFMELDLELISFHTLIPVEGVRTAIKSLCSRFDIIDGVLWVREFLFDQKNIPLNPMNNAHKQIATIIAERTEFLDAQDLLPCEQDEYKRASITTKEVVWIRDGGICQYTKAKIDCLANYELDHIYPRAKGGGDDYMNLACCTKEFNRNKRDKVVDLNVPHYSASLAKRKLMTNSKLLDEFNSFFDRSLLLIDGKLRESNGSLGAKVSPTGKGTTNSSGKCKAKVASDYTQEFEEWWGVYKTGVKSNAFEAWKKQSPMPENLIDITKQYKAYCASADRQVKDGQGFLNQRMFESEWTHVAQGTKPNLAQYSKTGSSKPIQMI